MSTSFVTVYLENRIDILPSINRQLKNENYLKKVGRLVLSFFSFFSFFFHAKRWFENEFGIVIYNQIIVQYFEIHTLSNIHQDENHDPLYFKIHNLSNIYQDENHISFTRSTIFSIHTLFNASEKIQSIKTKPLDILHHHP